jgi:hypothetical protein
VRNALLTLLLLATIAGANPAGFYAGLTMARLRGNAVTDAWADAGLNTGLVSYWAMRTNTATTVFDEWGTNTGTAVNGVLFGSAYGKRDEGAGFASASTQHITAASTMVNVTNEWTVMGWHNATNITTTSTKAIWSFGRSSSDTPVVLLGVVDSGGNKIRAQYRNDANVNKIIEQLTTAGLWYHAAFVKESGGTIRLYVNGVQRGTETVSGAVTINQFAIGALKRIAVEGAFDGNIDELSVHSRALSSNEIFNAASTPLYAPYKE